MRKFWYKKWKISFAYTKRAWGKGDHADVLPLMRLFKDRKLGPYCLTKTDTGCCCQESGNREFPITQNF